jgi:sugar lactone lactonase YvrE
MDASRIEFLRGPSGRLLQYDPSTDEVTVLARELYFANGIAVAEDESYLVFVETFYSRVTKLYLRGEKQGTTEYLIDGHPSPACKYLSVLVLIWIFCFEY